LLPEESFECGFSKGGSSPIIF